MSGIDLNDLAQRAGPGAVVRSIASAVPTRPPARPEPDIAWPEGDGSVAGMLATPPAPRAWLIKNRLLRGRAAVLAGIGAAGKSTMLLHLAIGACIGRMPWDWLIDSPGHALILATEDIYDDVHHSLAAMTADFDEADIDLLRERLHVFPTAGQEVRLLSLDGRVLRENARGWGLIEKCRQYGGGLAFIGLDPALALSEGDEMDQAHQRYLGQYADRLAIETGATVVLATHATKASATADEIGSHQSRGGGGITDAVRAEFVMRTMTVKEAEGYGISDAAERKAHVQVVFTKGNKLAPDAYAPLWLRRGTGGVLMPAALTPIEAEAERVGLIDMRILDVLRVLVTTATPTLAEWREACITQRLITGTPTATKKTMERVVARLRAANLIRPGVGGRGLYVPVSHPSDK